MELCVYVCARVSVCVCVHVCVRVIDSPSINDRKSASVDGPGPASQAQHSQDKGPEQLAVGIRQRRSVPQRPGVVHKSLNVLQKGQSSPLMS